MGLSLEMELNRVVMGWQECPKGNIPVKILTPTSVFVFNLMIPD